MIEVVKTALQGLLASFVRTLIPLLVAVVASALIRLGFPVDEEFNGALVNFVSALLGAVAAALYYIIVRVIEKTQPWASKLLGSSQTPVGYADSVAVTTNEIIAVPINDVKSTSTIKKAVLAEEGKG